MLPFHKILFPVDFSAPCTAIIPYVQEMACHFSAELTVCHAYAPYGVMDEARLVVTDPDLEAESRAFEEDRLRQFACQTFPGQKVQVIAELGEPAGVIDRVALEQRSDLVMLATRGRGAVRRFLLGSVTAKVLHDISTAVWTGVGAELTEHPVNIPSRSIVCALPDNGEAEGVLRAAACMASVYQAELSIIHVVPVPTAYPDLNVAEYTQDLIEASQFRMRELMAKLGVDAPHTVIDGFLTDAIHQEVVRRKADLVITGRGHSIGTFSRLWSHLYSIIRDSPCPVLSV